MPFELKDHTADIAVAAHASGIEAVFASVADGLAAAMCDEIPDVDEIETHDTGDDEDDRFSFSVTATSREALLYDYLADLIYERDVRAVLPVDNEVVLSEPTGDPADGSSTDSWHLDASARGVPLGAIDAREVKAVTYSEMALEDIGEEWRAYVVFDV